MPGLPNRGRIFSACHAFPRVSAQVIELVGVGLGVDVLVRAAPQHEHRSGSAFSQVLRGNGGEVTLTYDREEGERLLAIRRAIHPTLAAIGTTLIEDVSVPRSALPAMFDEIALLEKQYGLTIRSEAIPGGTTMPLPDALTAFFSMRT